MYRTTVALILLTLVSAFAVPAAACIHLPAKYEGSVEQTSQGAIIFWNKGRQELILKPAYKITAPSDGALPEAMAWVIPLPAAPDHYAVEDPKVFKAAYDAFKLGLSKIEPPTLGLDDSRGRARGAKGIKLMKRIKVGEYSIQPIKTTGKESGEALNAWLKGNGFGAVPTANMNYYLERNWVWLAVKAELPQARVSKPEEIEAKGTLKPLRISFATPTIVYPLKFSTHQGVFDVTLYVVTAEPLAGFERRQLDHCDPFYDMKKEHPARKLGFWGTGLIVDLPEKLAAVQARAKANGFSPLEGKVILTEVSARKINGEKNPIAGWAEDLSLTPQ